MEELDNNEQQESDEETVTETYPSKEQQRSNTLFGIDYYLISTVSLAIISFCALFVSIYQTNVLSGQQEVMAAQQEIMMRNARAQLWPNLEISVYTAGYSGYGQVDTLQFGIANTGTGPAVIESVSVQYKGEYVSGWSELLSLIDLPDSASRARDNSPIYNRVVQAGEKYTFLSLNGLQPLQNIFMKEMDDKNGPTITICYRSVFNEHWLLERKLGEFTFSRAQPIDACTISDSIAFLN